MSRLEGKRVLITGGASGIGYCTAEEFARAKSVVVITDVNAAGLEAAAAKLRRLGAEAHAYVCDVSRREAVEEMARRVEAEVGEIDVLVNNAGIGYTGELEDTTLETWRRLIDVNLLGPLHHVHAFLPGMLRRRAGQIVNISSGQAFLQLPTWGAYASLKAALGVFSEVLHYEVRRHDVTVTTVYPFMVNTPFYREAKPASFAGRLSMRLVPYYSMSPERVGRIIFDAVERRKRVETVSVLNDLGRYLRCLPLGPDLIGVTAELVLGKRVTTGFGLGGILHRLGRIVEIGRKTRAGDLGFRLEEVMSGTHEFEPGCGPAGKHPMEFRVTWGADSLAEFVNPLGDARGRATLKGMVTVGEMCHYATCEGTLDLRYLADHSIRYRFEFEAGGARYLYVGDKVNIWPWNLPVSHTTCTGTITEAATGKLVSRSLLHFRLEQAVPFAASFRLT